MSTRAAVNWWECGCCGGIFPKRPAAAVNLGRHEACSIACAKVLYDPDWVDRVVQPSDRVGIKNRFVALGLAAQWRRKGSISGALGWVRFAAKCAAVPLPG